MKKSKKSIEWNKVTPLSKYLAMALFIALPFMGFWLGMKYQQIIDSYADTSKTALITKIAPTELPKPIKCGEIPNHIKIEKDHFTVVKGPTWSPDCKFISWSSWQSTFANPSIPVGLFLYSVSNKETKRVYMPKQGQNEEDIELQNWQNNNVIVFIKDGQGELFGYDLLTNKVTSLNQKIKVFQTR